MRIADSTIQEVSDKLDAAALVGDHVRLDKRNGSYWGCCPFHHEKTPSFKVDPDRKLYYCFGCHKGGTIISFIMEMETLSFAEAIEFLAKRYGIPVIYEGRAGGEEAAQSRREDLYELYQRVSGSFHYLLMETAEGAQAKNYILERGLDEEALRRFQLGYTPRDRSWLFLFLTRKGYSPELLAGSGLFSPKYPQAAFFSNRLMFPIRDQHARPLAFGARLLAGEGPKYLNSGESELYKKGKTLFALDLALPEIRKTKAAYIVEGYMDVIALRQAGIANAVAPLGTALTDEQAQLLHRWADKLYLMFDADEAGQKAALAAVLTARRNSLACSVIIPGTGEAGGDSGNYKDPADILQKAGPKVLHKSAQCFINDFEYLVNRARTLYDPSTLEGKAKAAASLFPYIETLDSEVLRDSCMRELASAFAVEWQAAQRDFTVYSRNAEPKRFAASKEVPPPQTPRIRFGDELRLLAAVLVNNSLFPKLRSTLSIEELEDPWAKALFIALEEWFRDDAPGMGEAALPHTLVARIPHDVLRNYVVEQDAARAFSSNPELYIEEGIRRVKQKRLERRQAEIVVELRAQQRRETGRGLEDLLVEKMHIDAELRRLKEANE
ncbi:MAG: DNA primase [Treponema sp.]|jgi:DNA primase|nr:DNA primase [Treponema sp.]